MEKEPAPGAGCLSTVRDAFDGSCGPGHLKTRKTFLSVSKGTPYRGECRGRSHYGPRFQAISFGGFIYAFSSTEKCVGAVAKGWKSQAFGPQRRSRQGARSGE